MARTCQVAQPLVEDVAPDLVVANALDLKDLTAKHAAKGQIESAAAPVEDQEDATFEFGQFAAEVGPTTKVGVERCDRLMDKLYDPDAGLTRSCTQLPPLWTLKVDRDRHHRAVHLVGLAAGAWFAGVIAEEGENLGDGIGRRDLAAVEIDRSLPPETHFR